MKIKTALKTVRFNIEAEMENVGGVKVTTLSGKPGIGKTERTRVLASEMGLNFYHVSAPEVSVEQLTGLPEFEQVDDGFEKYSVSRTKKPLGTSWSCPEIIATANRRARGVLVDGNDQPQLVDGKEVDSKGCLILLDDLHETPLSTIPYFYQLLNEKKVSGWALDEKVYIVAAMNDSDSANFAGLPSPIINRMSILKTEFDEKEFLDNYSVNFNYIVRSLLIQNPSFLNEKEETEMAFGTPRSWTQANNSFDYMYKKDKEFALENIKDIFSGSVSDKAALEIEKMAGYMEKLDLEKYVKEGVKEIKDGKPISINISEMEQLDQVLMGYIVNFINTVEDSLFLKELLDKNLEERAFVGFCVSEIYLKYMAYVKQGKPITDGLRLFLEKVIGVGKFDISTYNVDKKTEKLIENYKVDNKKELLQIVQPYIC